MSMNDQERRVIEDLFSRMEEVERSAPPRDAEAEAFIQQRIARQRGAPYYMAQTLVMQEMALQQAQQRIEALERSGASQRSSGGLLSGLFGGGGSSEQRSSARALAPSGATARFGGGGRPMTGGGGFLAGAAQTAMGVAGGVLLANAVSSFLGGGEAHASESTPSENDASDVGSGDDGGSFGDDLGGDF